jgi:hypothetical protein
MQQSMYQANRQQLLLIAGTIFGSIVAAVIVSTVVIMSLMQGQIANALASNVQNTTPAVSQTAASCVAPAVTEDDTDAPVANSDESADAAVSQSTYSSLPWNPTATTTVNNTNVNTSNTTNNVTNTEVHKKTTVIKDSFNDNSINSHNNVKIEDSFNPVIIKDNEVNVNSNNKTTNLTHVDVDKTYNVNSNNVTVASNNTTNVNSNNYEKHVLSDNNTIIAPLVVTPAL